MFVKYMAHAFFICVIIDPQTPKGGLRVVFYN
jgi:hypothetical protein